MRGYEKPLASIIIWFASQTQNSMNVEQHKVKGSELQAVRCTVITVSDTRTLQTDRSGQAISQLLLEEGHEIVDRTVVPDEPDQISFAIRHSLGSESVDVVLLSGGTGVSKRDGTVEVVRQFLETELPGFGELFRSMSYQEIGAAAMLSRAVGGIGSGKIVFALPGSTNAVRLGMEKLILPELRHLVYELRK